MHHMISYAIMLKTSMCGKMCMSYFYSVKNIISYVLAIVPKSQRNTRSKTMEEEIPNVKF